LLSPSQQSESTNNCKKTADELNDSDAQKYEATPVGIITKMRSLAVGKLLMYKIWNHVTFNRLYVTALNNTQSPHNNSE